jgi:4-diphosphocytidyl-2-C-methyl-D-erythritol kinase
VLAMHAGGLSTPAVYAEFDRRSGDRVLVEPRVSDALMQALRAGNPVQVGAALVNDLQDAACALFPGLRRTLDAGLEFGALGAVVSGSGPTVAFLVADAESALDLAVALTAVGTCDSVARAHGPVHGARVVDPPRVH